MLLHPAPAPAAAAVAVGSSSSCRVAPPWIPASPAGRRRRCLPGGSGLALALVRCAPANDVGGNATSSEDDAAKAKARLKVGSPIVVVDAPPMLKSAASVPSLRYNSGQVKAGDVGRVMARKPKDVWAVRLAAGTFLLDGKYFKPLDVVVDGGSGGSPGDDRSADTSAS